MDYTAILPELADFRRRFLANYPQTTLDDMDWRRCNYALNFIVGKSMCEVGPGVGHILNAVRDRIDRLAAIDIKKHSMAMFPVGLDYRQQSITDEIDMPEHDTVVCMEVIEHIPASENSKILANLRKLTKRRLILTVPFNEPEPLWHHDKLGGHRQRFTMEKLEAMFPTSYSTILPRYGVEWIFVVEDAKIKAPYFQTVSRDRMASIFSDRGLS